MKRIILSVRQQEPVSKEKANHSQDLAGDYWEGDQIL
jgi:hypothetical protein